MSVAVFRLESFGATAAPEPVFTRADLEAARAEGRQAALAEAQAAQHRDLTRALTELSAFIADDESRRRALRDEAVEALAPVLRQIVMVMAPLSASARMETALMAELNRISGEAPPLSAHITCSRDLRAMLDRCLAGTGLADITVTECDDGRLDLILQGGRIGFDPERVTRDLLEILEDIQKDDTTWTH
ncbi:hypothetical protein Q4511_14855 [Paracoccus sp. 1_MG-2023]|uniref:hypothetical protein n=1 Tax=unclassified Paracoccus (in: a-proteobacteria) TaxID=2688777 RepID=UPI001C084E00|nr:MULTISPECIES: hypothetical protein [unclassified Paracoccus (in: a-proteobacteria)]MBU2956819.1 hypothetical protein [Paracoccus sp. C2R09]MDO6670204.1 hypothetical protein [Paracoccus sp. 1_MG-2023]